MLYRKCIGGRDVNKFSFFTCVITRSKPTDLRRLDFLENRTSMPPSRHHLHASTEIVLPQVIIHVVIRNENFPDTAFTHAIDIGTHLIQVTELPHAAKHHR